ncbi:hypothetical protein [Collimonas sp. OK307]|uniref:hypothetical protein n=1 Tax=Collimonas sp. OK307 TaxID=1801620 RepID=UPI001587667A|nr:hypothetical protein [Collimonas sp. OK307]
MGVTGEVGVVDVPGEAAGGIGVVGDPALEVGAVSALLAPSPPPHADNRSEIVVAAANE